MIALPQNVRVHAACAPCDFRKQMDGLAALVRQAWQQDPENGDLFVFRNRRGDMLRVLFFDSQGFYLFSKRLERGSFRLDVGPDQPCCRLTSAQLGELLRGIPVVHKAISNI